MRLYLVQHGEALSKDADPDCPLSEKGRVDVARLAEWLDMQNVKVAQIFHSGKTRAQQTADLLRALLESGGEIRQADWLGPDGSPKVLLGELRDQQKDILVASHMPFVARVVSTAVTGGPYRQVVEFEPGSVVGLIRHDAQSWRLFLFARPSAF